MSTESPTQGSEATYSYDEIPYPSHPFEASHPDHIYTLARLFTMQPSLPENASILELGCASGGNLIPIAVQFPQARVVGVDLSKKQIAEGQAIVGELGLSNIQLFSQDFQTIDDRFGEFDYIICHGVFSWVPTSVQHRILEICQERLSENGIAYVSYNCYPGWFMRGMIRQMMLHHVNNIRNPQVKIQQARALLRFIAESTEGQDTPYATIIRSELELLAKQPDSYLFHEHLEENNRPMFFYEFLEMMRQHDLQFLGESSLASMVTSNLSPKAAKALTELTTDVHHRGQYTDFVTNRTFRQSLLCRKGISIDRNISPARMAGGFYAGNIRVEDESQRSNLDSDTDVSFACSNGRRLRSKNPALKALMYTLGDAWPASLALDEITRRVEKMLGSVMAGQVDSQVLTNVVTSNLIQLSTRGDIDFRFVPDRFSTQISDHPTVSALTRLQARIGGTVTTGRHAMLAMDAVSRLFVQAMDGNHNLEQLENHVVQLIEDGKIKVSFGSGRVDMTAVPKATVEKLLDQIARNALIVA